MNRVYGTISLKTGHLIRQIDAVTECLQTLRVRLTEIPDRYCENDGAELRYVRTDTLNGTVVHTSQCPTCGKAYAKVVEMDADQVSSAK